jgi:hypothetical protein|tara:strand:+ start:264 stop:521 length:258 start_codon:yes stop_codon:yes gene_type:complete
MSRILQTHLIRLDDGHCMTDWIDISEKTDMEIFHLKQDIKYGELDTKTHAVRVRVYPKENHLRGVKSITGKLQGKPVITKTGNIW